MRLGVVDALGHGGPAAVSELADHLGVPLPQLSNHLRRLRGAGLVRVSRTGRHAIYELADPGLEALLPLLDRLTGRVAPRPASAQTDFALGRTCYSHLAGRLGVALYHALSHRDALRSRADGMVELGPAATEALRTLGVDPGSVDRGRRRYAFECLDATEHAPHLAGALGDAVAESLERKGWVERNAQDRVVHITPAGLRGLKRNLGIALAA